jgi:uncharacterized protein (TIGR03437 family)
VALAVLGAAPAAAQRLNCQRIEATSEVRLEGTAEMAGDVVLSCTGGAAAGAGAAMPRYNFLLTTTGAFARRAARRTDGSIDPFIDAMILVGDPDPARQFACVPARTASYCAASAVTKPFPAGTVPNVFSGRLLQSNVLAFSDIPIPSPGGGAVTVRITNIRVNAAVAGPAPATISTSVQIFDDAGATVAVANPQQVAARAVPGAAISVHDAAGVLIEKATDAPLSLTPQQIVRNAPVAAQTFQIRVSESTKAAFRRRNIATTARDPLRVSDQSLLGLDYRTESGFHNAMFPVDGYLDRGGLADSGTRLRVQIEGIPENVLLWASVRDVGNNDTANPKALLTNANALGGGPLDPQRETVPGYVQIPADRGTAQVVWEIVSTDPESLETLTFSLGITANNGPAMGTATLRANLGPLDDGTPAAQTAVPRFEDRPLRGIAFRIAGSVQAPAVSHLSAATFQAGAIAPGSLVAAFGSGFASRVTAAANGPVAVLDNLSVEVTDSVGSTRAGELIFVSPGQVNYLMPEGLRPGPAAVSFLRGATSIGSGVVNLRASSPGLFSAPGTGAGPAAGTFVTIGGVERPPAPLAVYDAAAGAFQANALPLVEGEQVYLVLYGTGIRGAGGVGTVSATVGGVSVPVLYAAAHRDYPGLDQVNLGPLPLSLAGRGEAPVVLRVDGVSSNAVTIRLR